MAMSSIGKSLITSIIHFILKFGQAVVNDVDLVILNIILFYGSGTSQEIWIKKWQSSSFKEYRLMW